MIRNALFLTAALLTSAVGYSQTADIKKGESSDAKKNDPGGVEMTFANGSVVRMKLFAADIEVMTEFGKLTVPVRQIRRIEFGLHLPEGMDKKIEAAVKNLGSAEFKEREEAVRDLVALGAYAFPSLVQAVRTSADPEISKSASEAISRIKAKVPAKDLHIAADDRIVTPRFTIVGRILTPAIKAKSEYFGDVEHSVVKLRSLRVIAESNDTEVVVDAAKFAVNNQWMDTGVAISNFRSVSILASGEVELRPAAPGLYVSGPKGFVRNGPGALGAAGGAFPPRKKGGAADPSRIYPGTLLGRIGDGEVFVVGERYEGIPETEGKLFLQIVSSPYDNTSTGTYQVKISVRD